MEEFNKQNEIVFVDRSMFLIVLDSLIGSSGLLLVVSHLLAVPVF
jgi:hypothetical protein